VASEDLRAVFGRRVRELRLGLGLSQEELAERADLHRNYIGGIERGERNVGILNIGKLADALGVSLAEMFSAVSQRSHRRRW
jgi:transcriptional regulator with XRE-family HTH domain